MRKILWFILAVGAFWLEKAPESYALTVVDTVLFGNPLDVRDTLSGNDPNFSFSHPFASLDESSIRAAKLKITHEENANEGPTRELWSLRSESGTLIGFLSNSTDKIQTDEFDLSSEILGEILDLISKEFRFYLTEETSFNGEKIGLYQSVMEIDVSDRTPSGPVPNTPEPASWILLGLGILGIKLSRRLSGNAG